MDSLIGELAAFSAAFVFSIASVCYTFAGRKVNAITCMAISLPISWILILAIHQATQGTLLPHDAELFRWVFLSASGILAFVVSSYFMLNAYQFIGPRLTMLILSFAPALGALLAWIFLGQTLPTNATIGIFVVLFGIVWVVGERSPTKPNDLKRDTRRGILYACLGTLAQASAFVFSSQGVADGFPPFSATVIRITAGMLTLWVVVAMQGNIATTLGIFRRDRRLFLLLAGAALSGAVIAGSLLLLAFQHTSVGVATTLSHTTAIILIPVGYFVFQERITLRAIVGTIVSIVGIGILFMT